MKEFVTKLKFAEVHAVHKSHYVTQMLNRIAFQCSLSVGKDLVGNNDHWQGGLMFDSHFLVLKLMRKTQTLQLLMCNLKKMLSDQMQALSYFSFTQCTEG